MSTKRQNKNIDWSKQTREAKKIAAGFNSSLLKQKREKKDKQLRVPKDVHYKLKRLALDEEVKLSDLTLRILREFLEKN